MDCIKNPETGRMIKPGTKLYNKLIRKQEEMQKAYQGLYALGASSHELWMLIVLRVDPSLLYALSLVNTFTNKLIYEKYNLEKWVEYVFKTYWKKKYKRIPYSFANIQEKDHYCSFLPDKWWAFPKREVKLQVFRYMIKHLIDLPDLWRMYSFDQTLPLTIDEKNMLNCIVEFDTKQKRMYFSGCLDAYYVEPDLKQVIVINKKKYPEERPVYIRTHKYTDQKPVYLCLPADSYTYYTDITEYFDDVF